MRLKIDTSSLIYAVKTGIADMMFKLFDEIIISDAIAREAQRRKVNLMPSTYASL